MYSPWRHVDSVVWKRRPLQLTFFVTRKCNARCPYCFYLNGATPPDSADGELTLEEIRRIARSLGPLLWLAFSGGEPFLRKDLVEISRVFYAHNRPAIMLYPTNGLLPELIYRETEQILSDCPRSTVVVKLSLDGIGADHDALRRTPGGFARVMQTYRRLAGLLYEYPNFELGINTVFLSENQDKMDEIIDFVGTLAHVKTHTISLARGELADPRYQAVDADKYRRAVARLEANLKNRTANIYRFRGARLKAAQDILQRRLIHRTVIEQRRQIPCYAGRLNLVLTETGEVYPCEMLDTRLGNVREYHYDLARLLRSEAARTVNESIMDNRCYCTHECYFITNILFNPRLYPALLREYRQLSRRSTAGARQLPVASPE
jgi:radical SAM protein with 4Fe4S-binding SPASM domain